MDLLLKYSLLLLAFGSRFAVGQNDIRVNCETGKHDVDMVRPDPQAPDKFVVTFKTTASEDPIVIEVNREWSPLGADRFYQLVLDNYFNCATFFRVVPNFVVQFGLTAEPEETKKWGHIIEDDKVIETNSKGMLSFATSGPKSRTTQIFINLKKNTRLDGMGFSPFAKVVEGMEVVEKLMNPTPGKGGGVDQGKLTREGNAYALSKYPEIDMILSTAHVGPEEQTEEQTADP